MLQVLERECDPEVLPKKRAKVQGKRLKDYPKVGLRLLLTSPGLCASYKRRGMRMHVHGVVSASKACPGLVRNSGITPLGGVAPCSILVPDFCPLDTTVAHCGARRGIHRRHNRGPCLQVPYMVAICMRKQALPEKVMPEWEEMCAVASAVQNLWLAATAHGIAGVHSQSHYWHGSPVTVSETDFPAAIVSQYIHGTPSPPDESFNFNVMGLYPSLPAAIEAHSMPVGQPHSVQLVSSVQAWQDCSLRAGYWSSWTAEARDSQDMKDFLGLGPEDKCLGVFMLGKCADLSACRSTRRPLSEKVDWRL